MNLLLLKSSLILGLIQLFYIYRQTKLEPIYSIFILIGIFTSIINHLLTDIFVKYLDRLVMLMGYFINICILIRLVNIVMIIYLNLAIICYFISKIYNYSFIHVLAHIIITYINIYIIVNF